MTRVFYLGPVFIPYRGGLAPETLALGKMVEDRALFSGPPNCKVFVHNVQGIRNNIFYYAGLFVALSIVNGGAGLECLSETVYNYICHGLTPGNCSAQLMKFLMVELKTACSRYSYVFKFPACHNCAYRLLV